MGHKGTTTIELALDFEVATGCELPFPKKPGATGPGAFLHAGDTGAPGRSPATAAERARLFGNAWRGLERLAGKQLHPGRKDKLTRSLQPLGYHPPLSGFSRRPVLLGGENTERALRGLFGLPEQGWAVSGNPGALRRRPMYPAGRACLLAESTTPVGEGPGAAEAEPQTARAGSPGGEQAEGTAAEGDRWP